MFTLWSMGSWPIWYQDEKETCYIPKVSKFCIYKEYLCQQAWNCHLEHINVHIADQNIMQNGNPIKLNFEGLERQRCYIPMDTAQRVDNKNGIICLFIIFTPRVMVIKMSKMDLFCIFCRWHHQSQFGENN